MIIYTGIIRHPHPSLVPSPIVLAEGPCWFFVLYSFLTSSHTELFCSGNVDRLSLLLLPSKPSLYACFPCCHKESCCCGCGVGTSASGVGICAVWCAGRPQPAQKLSVWFMASPQLVQNLAFIYSAPPSYASINQLVPDFLWTYSLYFTSAACATTKRRI